MSYSSPYGFIRDGKVYLSSSSGLPERIVGEVRLDEEASIKHFEARFDILLNKVDDLGLKIESSENKGSYLMKLLHLRQYVLEFEALGDYAPVLNKLDLLEESLRLLIKENKKKNLELKKAMLAEAEVLNESPVSKENTDKYIELRARWIKTGRVDSENAEVEEKFKMITDEFFNRRKSFYEDKKKLNEVRLEKYNELIEAAKVYLANADDKNAVIEIKNIQQKWKKVGRVSTAEKKELDEKFNSIIKSFFALYRKNNSSFSNNFGVKEDLLKQVEAVLDNIGDHAPEIVKNLKDEWFKTGRSSNKDLEQNFFTKCDLINEKLFLEKIANSKFRDFRLKPEKEQYRLRIQIMQDLLSRDQHQLDVFKENLENLNVQEDSFNNLMTSKLQSHHRKVKIKQQILNELSEKVNLL